MEYKIQHLKFLQKKKNLRIVDASNFKLEKTQNISSIMNSILIQSHDDISFSSKHFKVVSKKNLLLKNLKV